MRIFLRQFRLFLFLLVGLSGGMSVIYGVNVVPALQEQLLLINSEQPFVNFNLGLSAEEQKILTFLTVDKEDVYNNFYDLKQLVPGLMKLFISVGNSAAVASAVAKIIDAIVEQLLTELGCETAWVALRCYKQQDTFVVPRWHIDGDFPKAHATGLKYKIACALKGPTTLFCKVDRNLRQKFCEINKKKEIANPSKRQLLHELLRSMKISTAAPGEATLFLIGADGAIHSEPDINQDRIYLEIFPGSKAQLQELI